MARSRFGENQVKDADFLSEDEHDLTNHYFRDLTDVTTYSGNAGKYVKSNAAGTGLEYENDWIEKEANYTASNQDKIFLTSSGGSFTIDMPTNPSMGDRVSLADGGYASTNNITVSGGGKKILGQNQNYTINTDYKVLDFIFFKDNSGWIVKD